MLGRISGYRLNEQSLVDLEASVSADVAARLRPLRDRKFDNRAEFSVAVKAVVGDSLPARSLAAIIREGQRFQPKRLARYSESTRRRYLPGSPFTRSFFDYVRLRPVVFQIWFRYRLFKFVTLRKSRREPAVRSHAAERDGYIADEVLPYNLGQLANFNEAHRYRTERVIRLLALIAGSEAVNLKIVSVGPRNEAELLLFSLLGFPLRNITGVDLFSYSPHIQVMDMHDLRFPDDTFDVYYSAYTLAYSQDVKRACAEAVRVTKDGGLIALTMTVRGVALLCGREDPTEGAAELLSLFGPHVRQVYFQENSEWRRERVADNEHRYVTVIFSLRKSRSDLGNRPA